MIELDYSKSIPAPSFENDIIFDNSITASEIGEDKMYFIIYVIPSFLKLDSIPEILKAFYFDLLNSCYVSIRAVLSNRERDHLKNSLIDHFSATEFAPWCPKAGF